MQVFGRYKWRSRHTREANNGITRESRHVLWAKSFYILNHWWRLCDDQPAVHASRMITGDGKQRDSRQQLLTSMTSDQLWTCTSTQRQLTTVGFTIYHCCSISERILFTGRGVIARKLFGGYYCIQCDIGHSNRIRQCFITIVCSVSYIDLYTPYISHSNRQTNSTNDADSPSWVSSQSATRWS